MSIFSRQRNGFTIIELLIVIGIIGIIAAVGAISYNGVTKNARDKAVLSDMEGIEAAETSYGLKNGGNYLAWYSGDGTNSTLRITPSTGNIIDVAVSQGAYCIRIYNTGSNYGTIHTAAKKGSSTAACNTLLPSTTAIAQSPPAPAGTAPIIAVTFKGATANNSGSTNSNSVTVTTPSDVANGDLMLVAMTAATGTAAQTFNAPSGWTKVMDNMVSSPSYISQAIFYKFANNEPASYAFTNTGAATCCKITAVNSAYSGVNTTTPIAASDSVRFSVVGSTVTFNTLSSASSGYVVMAVGGRSNSSTVALGVPTISGYQVRQTAQTPVSSFMSTSIADGILKSAGASMTPPAATYAVQYMIANGIILVLTPASS